MSAKQIFETLGNVELLSQNRAALFASRSAPREIYADVFRLLEALAVLPLALAGGWLAALEKELLKKICSGPGHTNVIHYLAKNINTLRPDKTQQRLLDEKRLLFISPGIQQARASAKQIARRDELLFSQINKIIFLYIAEGGRLQEYFERLLAASYQVFLFDHPLNEKYFNKDVVLLNPDNCGILLDA